MLDDRVVEADQLGPVRVRWRGIVDLLLTHLVSCIDNARVMNFGARQRSQHPVSAGEEPESRFDKLGVTVRAQYRP